MQEQLNLLMESSQEFLNEIAGNLPKILGALFILILGWIIAKLVKRLFVKLLRVIKFSYLTEKSGVEKFLKDGGVKTDSIAILGTLLYWIIMLFVIVVTFNSLNLSAATAILNKITLFIPRP